MKTTLEVVVLGLALTGAGVDVARAAEPATARSAQVKRGEALVQFGSCNDCHTPWHLTPKGPAPDTSRLLSGHPEAMALPPPPAAQGPWMTSAAATNTAWAGPWGVSFTANLTPDAETGLGTWTEQTFIATMRSGKHLGRGRPLLPPMPWYSVGSLSDADLKAVFAYLRSIPAIRNKVPEPLPPSTATAAPAPAPASKG